MLKILGRRPDGYHEIKTLMAPLELADTLVIEVVGNEHSGRIKMVCNDNSLPTDESNLVIRAASAYMARTQWSPALEIILQKAIPHGAGLGGGSSDAAATLMALDELSGCKIGHSALTELAAQLGSDVPFFLRGEAALCTGRGELVGSPPMHVPCWPILLVKPPFAVPTPWAYQAYAQSENSSNSAENNSQVIDGIALCNVLERPVFRKYVMLADLKDWLLEQPGVRAAMMSGSGSTIFAVLEDDAQGGEITVAARERYGETLWTCTTRIVSATSQSL